jgi:hypothetical protein
MGIKVFMRVKYSMLWMMISIIKGEYRIWTYSKNPKIFKLFIHRSETYLRGYQVMRKHALGVEAPADHYNIKAIKDS